jgi:hypothetical protein
MVKVKRYNLKERKEVKGKEPEIFISRELIFKMLNQLQEDDKVHTKEFQIKGFIYYGDLQK